MNLASALSRKMVTHVSSYSSLFLRGLIVAALGTSTLSVLNDREGVGLEALYVNNVSHANPIFEKGGGLRSNSSLDRSVLRNESSTRRRDNPLRTLAQKTSS